MKLLVLGASGGVGKHLIRLACDQGHSVTALVRRAAGVDTRARILIDDVLRGGCFDEHVQGHEVVLSALGIKRTNPANPWSALASPPDFSSRTATVLVNAMRQHGVGRVIAVSAAGVAESAARMNLLMRFFVAKSNVGVGYRDLAAMERVFSESGLDWCCPRPTRLTNSRLTRRVKIVDGFPLTAAISRADVAWWMLEHATQPARERTPIITGG
jgi:putative NADH-flavin reductase